MHDELTKMGADISLQADGLLIHGGKQLTGAQLSAHCDHRVGLALIVAALAAEGASTLSGSQWLNKSFPGFVTDMAAMGARLQVLSSLDLVNDG